MNTSQLFRLLTPEATGPRHVQRELARLRDDGLVAVVTCGRAGHAAWFLTEDGAGLAEESRLVTPRRYLRTAGLDPCGLLDWKPEVAHPVEPGLAVARTARGIPRYYRFLAPAAFT